MQQARLTERRRAPFLSATGALFAIATILQVSTTYSTQAAAQAGPAPRSTTAQAPATEQLRDRAPIGHRQPRVQDLPPAARRDESHSLSATPGERGVDSKLQICREC